METNLSPKMTNYLPAYHNGADSNGVIAINAGIQLPNSSNEDETEMIVDETIPSSSKLESTLNCSEPMEDDIISCSSSSDVDITYISEAVENTTKDDFSANTNDTAVDSYKSIHRFFVEQSKIANTLSIDSVDLNSCCINSILRPYQKETVQWMIMRETKSTSMKIGTWYVNLPRGGILADEMGLGKTVEVLACILGNTKHKIDPRKTSTKRENDSSLVDEVEEPTPRPSLGKRSRKTGPSFLAKKPHLSQIKQNPTLKQEIKNLLLEFFYKFKRKMKRELLGLNTECQQIVPSAFNVLMLHRYYSKVNLQFAKQQTWGYLVSEFDAHEDSSLAYSILLKESLTESETLPENSAISDEDAKCIIDLVNDFLTDRMSQMFMKEFERKIRLSILLSGDEFIPMLESNDVQCRCGSDKAKGRKIRCSKCQNYQHRGCVGLPDESTTVDDYCCPSCWMNEPPIQSAATLIVIPDTLTQQWTDEIKKHAADCNLKIYWYTGVSKGYVLPTILSSYDIVLITTCKLAADLSFVNPNSRSLRHVKRYQQFVTPLTCIRWWRLCIDEAQSVEGVNKVSEMASRLQTDHLWAVTGTPIGRSLRDLYGLAVYLRMEPFVQSDECWKKLISGDQSSLHLLFAHLMRRKTKVEVNDQLGLPSLSYDVQWLSFPPVEGYFYNATHAASQTLFLQTINKKNIKDWNQPLKKANRAVVDSILAPLLSLRQACVNPMVCSMNVFNLRKKETFQNLLEKMIKKTKVDCDDLLRLYIMLVNGAARLHLLSGKVHDAVALYRSILSKLSIYVDLKPDDFQLIHIMHNVYEAANRDTTIELTEEEKQFPQKIVETETKCLDKLQDEIDTMKTQLSKYTTEITNYVESFGLNQYSWWEKMLHTFNFDDVTTRITEDLERDHIELNSAMKFKMSSAKRLGESIKYWLADVDQKRSVTFDFLKQITDVDSRETLWTASDQCHLRNSVPKKTCAVCRMEELMLKYEALLFNIGDKDEIKDAVATEPNWKHTALECALNVLLSCSRTTINPAIDITSAGHQLKALSLLRREFKAIRAIWSRQCDLLNVVDEIRTAKSTLESDGVSSDLIQPGSTIFEHELETFKAQSTSAYFKLQQKYGSFQYLKNLDKRYKSDEKFEETCPVCHMSMDEKRAVMTCGHFTCYTCMQALMQRSSRNHVSCPVCRASVPISSVSYVHGGGTSDLDMSNVVGNYSIKILAITAKILELLKEDASVKILVFSTWEKILTTIEKAFAENNIKCQKYTTGQKRRTSLAAFKTKDDVNVLLMPLRSGGKGLNLTEASHIIFAEPVLNTADEKQAIGRIYRMGQQRPMTVHKFLVKSSVEEHLHKMNEELLQSSGIKDCELTFQHLRDLFEASSTNLTEI